MPAKFHFVSPSVWSRTFRNLSTEAQVVAFNVMTCRHRVSEGLYELSPGHVAADTGLSVEAVEKAFVELDGADVVNYDPEAEVVLDRGALKANPLRNGMDKDTGAVRVDKRIKGAVELFARVADSPLKAEFLALADEHSPDLAAAIREHLDLPSPSQGAIQGATEGLSDRRKAPTQAPPQAPPKDRDEKSREEKRRAREEKSSSGGSSTVNTPDCPSCGEPLGWCACKFKAGDSDEHDSVELSASQRLAARVAGGTS